MDEARRRYARELIEAINAALANDPTVRACRDRARAAGVDLDVSVEVAAGFAGRKAAAPVAGAEVEAAATTVPPSRRLMPAPRAFDVTAADRRFLRSLRIAAEETSDVPPRTPER